MPVKVKKKWRPLGRLLKESVLPRLKQATVWLKKKKPYTINGQDLTDDIEVTPPWTRRVAIGIAVGLFLVLNYLGTVLYLALPLALGKMMGKEEAVTAWEQQRPVSLVNLVRLRLPVWVYPFLLCVCLGIALLIYHKLSFKFRTLVKGQKGDNRLADLEELKDQYPAVPDRKKTFPGMGGVPISHYGHTMLIDTDTVNNCYIGNTRSGKDEMYVIPKIDIQSRAEEKVSMVLNDIRGEMLAASKEPLEKRGYEVQVLNLVDPMRSLSFQLLELIVYYWKLKEIDTVQLLVISLTFSLYHDPKASGNMIHFNETAQGVVSAIIFALLEECDKVNELYKVTMYNVGQFLIEMGAWKNVDDASGIEAQALNAYFETLPAGSLAKAQYIAANLAGEKERGSILSTVVRKLMTFQIESVAKMTSMSSFDLKRVGFPYDIAFEFDASMANQRVTVSFFRDDSLLGKEVVLPSRTGTCILNFPYELQRGDVVTLRYVSPEREASFATYVVDMPKDLDEKAIPLEEAINEFPSLKAISMTCQRKPLAVFMLTPDTDKSLHPIASIFVSQMYQVLSRNCSMTRGGKCFRRVNFIFNEFGNMSPINDLDSYVTACLRRNVMFDFFVQSLHQFTSLYGKEKGITIQENCQNTIYIMSKDMDTIETVQKQVGRRTVERRSTNDQAFNLNNSASTSAEAEFLLTTERLSTLIMGETVVIRSLHRQDKKRRKIRPYPIFNTKETSMPYRHEFLGEEFDTTRDLFSYDFPCLHWSLNLDDYRIDVTKLFSFQTLADQISDLPVHDWVVQSNQKEDLLQELHQTLYEYLPEEVSVEDLMKEIIQSDTNTRFLLAKYITDETVLDKVETLVLKYKDWVETEEGGA